MSTSSTPLFFDPPRFPKLAFANLGQNPDDWQHDITRLAYDQIPFVMSKYRTRIKLQRTDPSKGYAYGFIVVNDKATIPITVHDFEMDPLDIFYIGDKPYPLNERRFDEMLFNSKLMGGPKDVSDLDSSIYTGMYPPHTGKYVYSAAKPMTPSKFGAFLEVLSGRVREADIKKLGASLLEPDTHAGIYANRLTRVLEKFGELKAIKLSNPLNQVPTNIYQLIQKSPSEFLLRFASDRHWDPREGTVSRAAVFKQFGEKIGEAALTNNEFTWTEGVRPWTPAVWEDEADRLENPKKLSKPGYYRARTEGGVNLKGWFFPKVVGLDGGDTGLSLLSDTMTYALQDDIYGFEEQSAEGNEPPSTFIETAGERGCFQLGDGKVTLPLVIQNPPVDFGTHVICEVSDDLGMPYTLEIVPSVEGIEKSRKPNTFLVSNLLPWFRVGRSMVRAQDDATPKLSSEAIKRAGEKMNKSTATLRYDADGSYTLVGDVGALSGKTHSVDRYRTKFALVGLGMTPQRADMALAKAKDAGMIHIFGSKVPQTAAEKYGEDLKRAGRKDELILTLRPGLLKEAAVIDDEATLDRVLSLNLITPENMQSYLDGLPIFDEAIQRLAQLLILSRVGQKNLPQIAIKRTMEGMEQVTQTLKDISAGLKQQQSQGNLDRGMEV